MIQFNSYIGSAGNLRIELSAHQAVRLVDLLEAFVEEFFELLRVPSTIHVGSRHYEWPLYERWEKAYKKSPTAQELSGIVSTSYTNKVNRVSPHHINMMYQVFTGKGPIREFSEALLFLDHLAIPSWSPYQYSCKILPISQLREEGIDLLDQKALKDRLKKLAELHEALNSCE